MADEKKTEAKKDAVAETKEAAQVREITRALMEELMPAMVAAIRAGSSPQAAIAKVASPYFNVVCTECGQAQVGCGGKHVKMVVYPQRYPELATYFQGRSINGVRYLSDNETHEIVVPASAESAIRHAVETFEENERQQLMGRKKSHNSGDASNFQQANTAWR